MTCGQEKQKKLKALEKRYFEAMSIPRSGKIHHKADTLEQAAEMFRNLGDYKNSKSLVKSLLVMD